MLHIPSESNNPNTTAHLCIGLPDDPAGEMEAAAADAGYTGPDDNRCRDCGDITSGTIIAAQHCMICDACLAAYVVNNLGPTLVRDTLSQLAG